MAHMIGKWFAPVNHTIKKRSCLQRSIREVCSPSSGPLKTLVPRYLVLQEVLKSVAMRGEAQPLYSSNTDNPLTGLPQTLVMTNTFITLTPHIKCEVKPLAMDSAQTEMQVGKMNANFTKNKSVHSIEVCQNLCRINILKM